MERISSWFKVVLTWIVIIPNLFLSYYALRNPYGVELASLGMNFITTTVLFYIYMDMGATGEEDEGGIPAPSLGVDKETSDHPLYKMVFGSLIEDMGVWLGLFFLLYNIVPVTLYVHNWVANHLA